MRLYDTTLPYRSIIHQAWKLCDANITSYPLQDVIRELNGYFEELVGDIINADGRWQFDDSNYTDFPIGTYTLVNGQSRYSFNDKFLQLEEVQILNKNGDYQIIHPIDQKEYSNLVPLSEAYGVSGFPQFYDKVSDDTIDLLPAPDNGVSVTLASGLKIKFKRTSKLYTMSDSTTITSGEESREPGIPSPYHMIFPYAIAIPYNESYHPERVARQQLKLNTLRDKLLKHYGRRQKDQRKVATMKSISFR